MKNNQRSKPLSLCHGVVRGADESIKLLRPTLWHDKKEVSSPINKCLKELIQIFMMHSSYSDKSKILTPSRIRLLLFTIWAESSMYKQRETSIE